MCFPTMRFDSLQGKIRTTRDDAKLKLVLDPSCKTYKPEGPVSFMMVVGRGFTSLCDEFSSSICRDDMRCSPCGRRVA